MSTKPSKYDAVATTVRTMTDAETVIVIVLDGNQGTGFAVQSFNPKVATDIPELLRTVAAEIEAKERGWV